MHLELSTQVYFCDFAYYVYGTIIIIIIEGLSLLQSIPPATANKQTQAQKMSTVLWSSNILISKTS